MRILRVCTVFLLAAVSSPVWGQADLYLEFWTERDAILHPTGSPEERLLREMQHVVSGMIYGYEFDYTPAYRDRNVEERFVIDPVSTIPWGDPAAQTLAVVDQGTTVYGQFVYQMNSTQTSRRQRWETATVPDSAGSGTGDIMDGYGGKIAAIDDGVRVAVRTLLQKQTRNRPREATGMAILQEAPHVFIDEGRYVARVRVRVLIQSFTEYESF